jgi:hypothetical protein
LPSKQRRSVPKLEGAQSKVEEAHQARRESFEQARKAGLTLGEAAELHWTSPTRRRFGVQ